MRSGANTSYAVCGANADGAHPTASDSRSYTYKIQAFYTATTLSDVPPSSIVFSYHDALKASHDYALFGSTTLHYTVSAAYSVTQNFSGVASVTLSDDTGGRSAKRRLPRMTLP